MKKFIIHVLLGKEVKRLLALFEDYNNAVNKTSIHKQTKKNLEAKASKVRQQFIKMF